MSPGTSWIHNTCNQVHILELVILMSEALETLTRPWSPQPQCPNFKRRSLWLWRSLSCFLWNNKWRWINRADQDWTIFDSSCEINKNMRYKQTKVSISTTRFGTPSRHIQNTVVCFAYFCKFCLFPYYTWSYYLYFLLRSVSWNTHYQKICSVMFPNTFHS